MLNDPVNSVLVVSSGIAGICIGVEPQQRDILLPVEA
jgi:hypothetical protein